MVAFQQNQLDELLSAIHERYHFDFRQYSVPSLQRRLRMALSRFNYASLDDLRRDVILDHQLFLRLIQYLTISTSEMFRDPSYFKSMRVRVIPYLKTYPSVKIWIAGCSTGEEVYSFAILLHEEDLLKRTLIYATDINPSNLQKAEAGAFHIDLMRKYTENYQRSGGISSFSDYYQIQGEMAHFDPELRKGVLFADHSLATDHVFSEVHLVSCRNVLIYFNKELQNRSLGLFHDSLVVGGFLGLGPKETLRFTEYQNRFSRYIPTEKIFQKSGPGVQP